MSAETEHILERLKQTKNVTNKRGKILKKQTRFLSHRERTEREKEKGELEGFLGQPPWAMKDVSQEGVATLRRRLHRLEDEAEEYYPPAVSGETKDKVWKYCEQLRSEWMEGMPTQEVMRRNPAGAVDMHTRWENRRHGDGFTNKEKIRMWKSGMRVVEPDNDEKDYTNIERFRPSGLSPDAAASFMMSGQIPGHFAQSALAKANWPENMPQFGTADSALKQAERNEIADGMVARGYVPASELEALKAEIKKMQEQMSASQIKIGKKRGRKPKAGTSVEIIP